MVGKKSLPLLPVIIFALILLLSAPSGVATNKPAGLSPEGYWQTVPDDDGSPSVIQVWLEKGIVFGKVIKIYPKPGKDPDPICEKCKGELKDQPIIGMTILNNLVEDKGVWAGGRILDPNNGKTYKCRIEVIENGKKLKVRGFIGISLLGRTQLWEKVDKPD